MARDGRGRLTPAAVLGAMGPGLLAALAGNDAGGIATYSSAGADFGYGTLWILPVMAVLLIVVQETAARCGCVTGKGFASLIRERFGVRLSALAMAALLVANTAVTISEFAGIASGLALFGVPAAISVPLVGLVIWLITMSGSFQRIEKILLLVSCVFVTYVAAAFLVGPDLREVAAATVAPRLVPDSGYVSLLVATIGTTIAPWMIFLAQNNVVDKNVDEEGIALQRIWYERTLARFRKAERRSQALLIPEPMEFEPVLADVLLKNMATLEAAGFAVEEFGRNFFRVTEIPDWLSLSADVRMFVRDLVDRIARLPAEFSRGNVAHDAIARIAAAQAARNREAFSDEEIPALLDELFATAQPNVGPNGQKIFFEISRAEIARRLQ